jgi:FkbM family methyltransferase
LSDITRNDSDWHIERCAVGDINGEIEINIAGNSASSSIREMLPSHYIAAPDSSYVGVEKVEIFKLDSIAKKYIKYGSNIFLKIDTQGYEENVIIGAKDLINDLKVIQMELSLIELYQGQKLLIEMLEVMRDKGFTLWNLDPAFINPVNGQMLQLDAVFVKT